MRMGKRQSNREGEGGGFSVKKKSMHKEENVT